MDNKLMNNMSDKKEVADPKSQPRNQYSVFI